MSIRRDYETIVVGAGPAGLQLGYYLERAGRDYVVLERGEAGEFFKSYPRHRTLLSINKRFTGTDDEEANLRWDWNSLLVDADDESPTPWMRDFSDAYFPDREELVAYLREFARAKNIKIHEKTEVKRVHRDAEGFVLSTAGGDEYRCSRLVVATGIPKAHVPDIEGIELAQSYVEMSVAPEDFEGKRVLVLGKGNSGFETAQNLLAHTVSVHLASPEPLRMAWKTRFVGHLRAVNNEVLDTYRLKGQNVVIDANVARLYEKDGRIAAVFDYKHARESEELLYDAVLVCTGFKFDASIFDDSCRPELTIHDRFPAQTTRWESVNVPGLYFAGAPTQALDYKKTTSAFIHGFRYNARALFWFLEEELHGVPIPHTEIPRDAASMTNLIIERVNRSSALWQQFGFFCDVLVVGDDGGVSHYHDVPREWIAETEIATSPHYYVVTLEFGEDAPDPFDFERPHRDDADNAHESEALHPIVRRYARGRLVATHHVMEDISADWSDQVHIEPLRRWLEEDLDPSPLAESAE